MESRRWHTWAYLAVVALNAVSYEWIPAGASDFHLTWNNLAVALGTVIAVWGVLKRREGRQEDPAVPVQPVVLAEDAGEHCDREDGCGAPQRGGDPAGEE
ncbi:MAG TPA: hypothetical protein GX743_01445, partial [Actinomycetales bacterium]|nr:hypothetical protein [Actinomycetales bacterium]